MKKLLFLSLTLLSFVSQANEVPINKSASPGTVNVRLTGTGMSQFSILSSDLPKGYIGERMTLDKIDWQSAYYTADGIRETVKICYYPYGYGANKQGHCEIILPGTAGTEERFRSLRFGHQSQVTIRHELEGGRLTVHPTGQDKVVIHYKK